MIRKSLVAAVGLAGIATAPAMANTVNTSSPAYSCVAGTCTQSFTTPSASSGGVVLDWIGSKSTLQEFQLNLFNTSLGTLNSVSFVLSFVGDITSGSVTNNAANSQTFTFKQDTLVTSSSTISALETALSAIALDPFYTQVISNLGSGASVTLATPIHYSGSATLTSPTSAFAQGGGGTTNVVVSTATTDGTTSGGGNIGSSVSTLAYATLTVVYKYSNPAPEPISAALLASGLLGLGIIRRTRRRV